MILFDEGSPGALDFLEQRIFGNPEDLIVVNAVNHGGEF
jgi:hypothetical protein